jgi:glyoxylase-like metal-dependent hydrolase (beta-lactamase superfamily II)
MVRASEANESTRRVLKIAGIVVGAIVVLAIVGLVVLLQGPGVPGHSDYQIDLATLRKLADQQAGVRPVKINAAEVARANVPAAFFLGGVRFDRQPAVFPAYQILYPDNSMIVVDAPPGRAFFEAQFPGGFDDAAYHAEQDALAHARAIVITHEHADHLQGIAESPNLAAFAGHLMLTREQRDDIKWLSACKFPENVRASLHSLEYDHYYPLAPGVVLIKAPGHTVGSQIVYVRLADNSEYLLIGDVAWAMEQVTTPKCRPRLAELMMGESSEQVTSELRALHDLAFANPKVHIVVAHDAIQLADYESRGKIGRGFAGAAGH